MVPSSDGPRWSNASAFSFSFASDQTIVGACIFDDASTGSMLFGGPLREGTTMTFAAGESMVFETGHFLVTLE
jgi:hypothetical protein